MIVTILFADICRYFGEISVFCPNNGGADLTSCIIGTSETALGHGEATECSAYFLPSLQEPQLRNRGLDGRDHATGEEISLIGDPIGTTTCSASGTGIPLIGAIIHGLGSHGGMAAAFCGELVRGGGQADPVDTFLCGFHRSESLDLMFTGLGSTGGREHIGDQVNDGSYLTGKVLNLGNVLVIIGCAGEVDFDRYT